MSDFLKACEHADLETIAGFLENGQNPDEAGEYGRQPLHYAALDGNTAMIKLLIKHKANVNGSNLDGMTALHISAMMGDDDCVAALLDGGADSMAEITESKETPLHFASHQGHNEVVEKLLAAGADPNIRDTEGNSPLDNARKNDHKDCIQLIEKHFD